jgi:hypothetical protein
MQHHALRALEVIRTLAENAHAELGRNAGDGAKARPTVTQLNRTLERLASIARLADIHLTKAAEAEPARRPVVR